MKVLKGMGIGLLLVLAGFFFTGFFETPEPDEYVTYIARRGDTLNDIAYQHYKLNKPGLMTFEDYAVMVRVTNNKLHNLNRVLQIGDEVKVPVYKQ